MQSMGRNLISRLANTARRPILEALLARASTGCGSASSLLRTSNLDAALRTASFATVPATLLSLSLQSPHAPASEASKVRKPGQLTIKSERQLDEEQDYLLTEALQSPLRSEDGVDVYLLGTTHFDPLSACHVTTLLETVREEYGDGLAVVAVELSPDPEDWVFLKASAPVLMGLSPEEIKANGVHLVRQACFASKEVHALAAKVGFKLSSAEQLSLPPELEECLNAGLFYSQEQITALYMANRYKCQVVYMDQTEAAKRALAATVPSWETGRIAQAGIRVGMLSASGSQQELNAKEVELTKKWRPTHWETLMHQRDLHMAKGLEEVCRQVHHARKRQGKLGLGGAGTAVVAQVGKWHVEGIRKAWELGDEYAKSYAWRYL